MHLLYNNSTNYIIFIKNMLNMEKNPGEFYLLLFFCFIEKVRYAKNWFFFTKSSCYKINFKINVTSLYQIFKEITSNER